MQIKRIALGGIIMTVIMFTPTYACVGTSDGIASYRSMENYISQIEQNGILRERIAKVCTPAGDCPKEYKKLHGDVVVELSDEGEQKHGRYGTEGAH